MIEIAAVSTLILGIVGLGILAEKKENQTLNHESRPRELRTDELQALRISRYRREIVKGKSGFADSREPVPELVRHLTTRV